MKVLTAAMVMSAFFITSCSCSNSDPRQGGLFSYCPSKYEQRIQDRENELAAAEAENAIEENKTASLEKQKAQKQKEVSNLRRQLKAQQAKVDKSLKKVKDKQDPEYLAIKAKRDQLQKRAEQIERLEIEA